MAWRSGKLLNIRDNAGNRRRLVLWGLEDTAQNGVNQNPHSNDQNAERGCAHEPTSGTPAVRRLQLFTAGLQERIRQPWRMPKHLLQVIGVLLPFFRS